MGLVSRGGGGVFAEVVIGRHSESVLKPCPWTRE